MAGLGTQFGNELLEHGFGKTNRAFVANSLYVGFSRTTPTDAGGNITEPSAGAYARVNVPGSSLGAAAARAISNSAVVTYPTATADWHANAMTHTVLFDDLTSVLETNFLGFGPLTVPKIVQENDTPKIPIGGLTIQFTG